MCRWDGGFLRFLAELGLNIESEVMVIANSREGGYITIEISGTALPIGVQAAEQILVSFDA